MIKYLISFASRAMELADDECQLVGRESHAVAQQAKDAGVGVFGRGIDARVAPVRVAGDGTAENERLRADDLDAMATHDRAAAVSALEVSTTGSSPSRTTWRPSTR